MALSCPIPGNPGFYYHAGIVSWGIACNKENVPGVYIDVQKYLPWIQKHMADKGFTL
jgi:secreted trypsin-like serine protease